MMMHDAVTIMPVPRQFCFKCLSSYSLRPPVVNVLHSRPATRLLSVDSVHDPQSLICIDILVASTPSTPFSCTNPMTPADCEETKHQFTPSTSSDTSKVIEKFAVCPSWKWRVLRSLLMLPFLQHQFVYTNGITVPLFADFDNPEKYGLAPNKTVNLKITTSDKETIGAWFVISDKYDHALPSVPPKPMQHMRATLERHPTILFLHGNTVTRAVKARINDYKAFTSRLGVNVLVIDYRGFADSTGTPSEAGLVLDGRAAFDWLIENGAKPEDILIVGHSLGTGVTSQLVAQIESEKIACRGVVLLAPFSSITHAIDTYCLFGLLPVPKPISDLLSRDLKHKFNTLGTVPYINSPVLIAHAENDRVIPHSHSDVLFEAFLEPALPTVEIPGDPSTLTKDTANKQEERSQMRKEIVETSVVPDLGTISEARVGRSLTLVKMWAGGHDHIGEQEGLQDVIGRKFGLLD